MLQRDPDARDPHLRLYEVEQILGEPERALEHLHAAMRGSRVVTTRARKPGGIAVLALTRIALWEANLPLELIVDEDATTLHRVFIADDDPAPPPAHALPPHTVVFNTIAESDRAQPALRLAQELVDGLGSACINAPQRVAAMSRDAVALRFAESATVVAPRVERLGAAELGAHSIGAPLVVRPVGSQAGIGLARIDDDAGLRAHLAAYPADAYFCMPFVDYRSADGFFRKYRIMFVDGRPFACHLAISPNWMIHYYNAPMAEHAWMRAEEARFIHDLAGVFHGPLATALNEIATAIPLEYFGIDCAVAPDGRLLLFEADSAMLVHGTDPLGLYPYKPAAFARIKAALTATIARLAGRAS